MKTFKDYLIESKKKYEFKVGFAGTLPDDIEDKLESALQKYSLTNLSKGKRTPITEKPLDFPQLQNMEVTYYDMELGYPTTVQVLEDYLGFACGIDKAYIKVRNLHEPQVSYQKELENKEYEALLTTEDMGGESAQPLVGENRVMELLKELENARKERSVDPGIGGPQGESQDIKSEVNNRSPIGS